jgi:hypothetical protein
MTKIKVVDLEKLYNFVVEHFLILSRLRPQNVLCNSCLPSVKQKTLDKQALCRVSLSVFLTLGKEPVCQVFFSQSVFLHSANSFFAECLKNLTQQISWHSANEGCPVVPALASVIFIYVSDCAERKT